MTDAESEITEAMERLALADYASTHFPEIHSRCEFGPPERTSFPDSELLSKPGVSLIRLDPSEIARIGRIYIPMMQSGFTKQGAAAIFLLAYNLHFRAPGNNFEPVFYDQSVENLPQDTSLELLPVDLIGNPSCGVYKQLAPTANERLEALYFSYIATSLLRMFTKPHENYIRGWNQIVAGFSRFYNASPPVYLAAPSGYAIRFLKLYWLIEGDSRPRMSLYKLLYAGGGDHSKASALKGFLYDNYLPYSGLHIVDIFTSLTRALNCSNVALIKAIDRAVENYMFIRQRKCLPVMVWLMTSDLEDHKRRMWRYARIFDERFMTSLQTKSCAMLVYALAVALKEVAPGANDGVFKIAQLQGFSAELKSQCEKYGRGIVEAVRTGVRPNPEYN